MNETIRLDDMRLFAKVAAAQSFSAAARALGIPKQTLSRRIADLERALGVQLLHRTTRRLHPSALGAAYAERCAEIVNAADDANRALSDAREVPRGRLRVTADPLFGDAFVASVLIEYARRWPDVEIDVVLTRRRVDLVEEAFDVAFRIGAIADNRLTASRLGPARVHYCASPRYVKEHGAPRTTAELREHECLVVHVETPGEPGRWPVATKKGFALVPVAGRIRVNSFAVTYAAALAGLGIGLFPDFACRADLARRRLVNVLAPNGIEAGSVWIVHPVERFLRASVRAFVDLAIARIRL